MEQRDIELINQYMESDDALKMLYDEHVDFERRLEKFNNKPYLTPIEELKRKEMQKEKLRGRDMIEDILCDYRKRASKD
ncbi:MAG: DUF465 domain-containing protein [Deltaproteobacteria bacterium]|jgi:uncharacterized protein|nr:DUF465 domain-containing protein [Deltaproteobacteria bacterium]